VSGTRVVELLTDLRERGLRLKVDGERLLVAPKTALTPEIRDTLAIHKSEILPLLLVKDPEVLWRLDAMRGQIPTSGPIPFLVARDVEPAPGTCQSCGDPLTPGQVYRCCPCVEAATLALQESREIILGSPTDGVSE
jgi:hypothetical protein